MHGAQAGARLRCMGRGGQASLPPCLTVVNIPHEGLDLAQATEAHLLAFQALMSVVRVASAMVEGAITVVQRSKRRPGKKVQCENRKQEYR